MTLDRCPLSIFCSCGTPPEPTQGHRRVPTHKITDYWAVSIAKFLRVLGLCSTSLRRSNPTHQTLDPNVNPTPRTLNPNINSTPQTLNPDMET